jgi:hypothetical protein
VRRPQKPTPFIPYIYTREELRRLLDGITSYQEKCCKLEPITLRSLLLLLYGAGLRTSESIRVVCSDVDLMDSTLTIRVTKFYKTRRIAVSTPRLGGRGCQSYDWSLYSLEVSGRRAMTGPAAFAPADKSEGHESRLPSLASSNSSAGSGKTREAGGL